MANLASPFTTYSDTTPQMRVITDVISLIDPYDAPAIEAMGGLDGAASKFRFVNWPGVTPEWLEDTLSPLSSTLNNAATIASTDTTVTVTDPNMVQVGHILLIDAEQVWVSAKSASVITITRNFAGTQASHNSVATFSVIGMARLEGAASHPMGYTDRTTNSNHTQIVHKEIEATETMAVIRQYGIADEFDYQANKAIPELMRLLEKQLYYGQRKAGSSTTPRSPGGISTFVTDNLVSGATLAQSQFENAVMAAFNDGGQGPWTAICSPTNIQKIKNIYDSSVFLRVDRSENAIGMVIERIRTPFGDVDLLMDRWAPSTLIPILDMKHVGWRTLRPFKQEPLAKDGDSYKGEVVGEFVFCLRQDKAHAMLTNVS